LIAALIKERQETVRREFHGYRLARASRLSGSAWPRLLRRLFAGKETRNRGQLAN